MNRKKRFVTILYVILGLVFFNGNVYAEHRILFIGNSYTFQGPVPGIVRALAVLDGQETPYIEYFDGMDGAGGKTLEWHSTNQPTLDAISQQWDYVVLQDRSINPTQIGDPGNFKVSANVLFDLVKSSSPQAEVFLYETWARNPSHSYYSPPQQFENPEQMQAQLRFHYTDAVDVFIPENSIVGVNDDLFVIPVGDAWEKNYALSGLNLHSPDFSHANQEGRYLNGMVIYSMIYNADPVGLASSFTVEDKRGEMTAFNISLSDALHLQQITKQTLNVIFLNGFE